MPAAGRMSGVAASFLTVEDVLALPEPEQGGLIRGAMRPKSPAGHLRARRARPLVRAIGNRAANRKPGEAGSEPGFIPVRHPDTVLAPDRCFIHPDRAPAPARPSFPALAPDLAAETRSPSTTASDILEQVRISLEAGVPLAWIVAPATSTLTEHAPGGAARWLIAADTLDGGDVLPGFSLDRATLFA